MFTESQKKIIYAIVMMWPKRIKELDVSTKCLFLNPLKYNQINLVIQPDYLVKLSDLN